MLPFVVRVDAYIFIFINDIKFGVFTSNIFFFCSRMFDIVEGVSSFYKRNRQADPFANEGELFAII